MSPRDLIRAAQEAELQGDVSRATELLRRAAEVYRDAGNASRALQMLRQVRRLEGLPDELEPPVEEGLPELALVPPDEGEAASGGGVLGWDDAASAEVDGRALVERGPAPADPALDAWCSFCCRPRAEVGELVAGPAGAFICAGCLRASTGMLARELAPAATPAPVRTEARAPAPDREASPGEAPLGLVGQARAREALARAHHVGSRHLLLLAPEGSGKSTLLAELAARGQGTFWRPGDDAPVPGLLLVDDVDRLAPVVQAELARLLRERTGQAALLTARGVRPAPVLVLQGEDGALEVPTSAALAEATQGCVPLALLEQVHAAVAFEPLDEGAWAEVARRLLARRDEPVQLPDAALAALVRHAVRSPRAGHELVALLARLPRGAWSLAAEVPAGKGRARAPRKGARKKARR